MGSNGGREIEALIEALNSAEYWHGAREIYENFKNCSFKFDLEQVLLSFDYYLNFQDDDQESPFRPMFEINGKQYPMPLDALDDGVLETWQTVLGFLGNSDVLVGRISDLLWTRKFGSEYHKHALLAIESLLAIARNSAWQRIYKSRIIIRSYSLATQLGKKSLGEEALKVGINLARESLDSNEIEPGVVLPLLGIAISSKFPEFSILIEDSLSLASEKYASDPHILHEIFILKLKMLKPSSSGAMTLKTQLVKMWFEFSQNSSGLIKLMYLQKSREIARRYDLKDLFLQIEYELQNVANTEDLGLKEIRGTVEIPAETFQKYLSTFTNRGSIQENLKYFALHVPIELKVEETKLAQQIMKENPLSSLFSTNIIKAGYLEQTVDVPQAHLDHVINRNSRIRLELWGDLSVRILREIFDSKMVFMLEIEKFLSQSAILDVSDVSRFMRVMGHFWEGNLEEVSHLALARLELCIRKICTLTGLIVYRNGSNGNLGRFENLNSNLERLEDRMPEISRIYFQRLLAEQGYPNLRNEIYHGIQLETSEINAALIVHAILHLASLVISD